MITEIEPLIDNKTVEYFQNGKYHEAEIKTRRDGSKYFVWYDGTTDSWQEQNIEVEEREELRAQIADDVRGYFEN